MTTFLQAMLLYKVFVTHKFAHTLTNSLTNLHIHSKNFQIHSQTFKFNHKLKNSLTNSQIRSTTHNFSQQFTNSLLQALNKLSNVWPPPPFRLDLTPKFAFVNLINKQMAKQMPHMILPQILIFGPLHQPSLSTRMNSDTSSSMTIEVNRNIKLLV